MDITKCTNWECEERKDCLRYTARSSGINQSYSFFKPDKNGYCEMKINNRKKEVSSNTTELVECSVCWGVGKIEIDTYGNEADCSYCNGTGFFKPKIIKHKGETK